MPQIHRLPETRPFDLAFSDMERLIYKYYSDEECPCGKHHRRPRGEEGVTPTILIQKGNFSYLISVGDIHEAYEWLGKLPIVPPDYYVFTAEAWALEMSSAPDDVIGTLKPSINPNSVECIVIYGENKDGVIMDASKKIIRDGDKVILEKWRDDTNFSDENPDGKYSCAMLSQVLFGREYKTGYRLDAEGRMQLDI